MAVLSALDASSAGINPVGAAAAALGDSFICTEREVLMVNNPGIAACVVTIATPMTVDDQAVASRVVNVPAGENRLIGPFNAGLYSSTGGVGGSVAVAYDQVTDVTVQLISIPS